MQNNENSEKVPIFACLFLWQKINSHFMVVCSIVKFNFTMEQSSKIRIYNIRKEKYKMEIIRFESAFGTLDAFVDSEQAVWFNSKQVLEALNDLDRHALMKLDSDEKQAGVFPNPGSPKKSSAVSESGFYSLVMKSRKENAIAFKRWVTHEVLPSIRKNGGYILGQENLPLEDRKALEEEIKSLRERVAKTEADLKKAQAATKKVEGYLDQTEDNSELAFSWYRAEAAKRREEGQKLEDLQKIISAFAEALGTTGMFEKFIKCKTVVEFDAEAFQRDLEERKAARAARPKKVEADPLVLDAEGMVVRQSELLSRDKRNWIN